MYLGLTAARVLIYKKNLPYISLFQRCHQENLGGCSNPKQYLRHSKRKASSPPPLPPPKSTVNEPEPDIQAIPPLAEAIAKAVAESVQTAVTAGIKAALKDSSGGVLNDSSPSPVTTEAVDTAVNELMS